MKKKVSEIVNDYLSDKSSENELKDSLAETSVSGQPTAVAPELDKAKRLCKDITLSNKKLKAL
jgi:hypothetical protein